LESSKSILAKIFAEYYLAGSQAKKEGRPIAYVSAFTPVEILRAMDVVCLYPESYAVVCSASNKSREMIHASKMASFSQDLCSYCLISFGVEHYPTPPYGGLPEPDMLIASNNQCGTTLLWFKLLSQKKKIPLFIIDYPAAIDNQNLIKKYIEKQYESLIKFVKKHTSNDINNQELSKQIDYSRKVCDRWAKVHDLNKEAPVKIDTYKIINALFPVVVARGTKIACDFYEALISENLHPGKSCATDAVRLLWLGYPMWFLGTKFPDCFDDEFQIVLNDYTLWWNLDYKNGKSDIDAMITAYSNTYLNWPINRKIAWADTLVTDYSVDGVIFHANRSCRRSLAGIFPSRNELFKKGIPSIIIESDMANPSYFSREQVKLRIEAFRDILKVK
jgi:benzoyl-CoA reductase/2-hydroxyglutaryl-CoA dehydratase subunit BcrC/BadD/HgdB